MVRPFASVIFVDQRIASARTKPLASGWVPTMVTVMPADMATTDFESKLE